MGGRSKRPGKIPIKGDPSWHGTGQPPLLTPKLHKAIVDNIELLGMPEGPAGQAEGVSGASVSIWKTRGFKALEKWDTLTPAMQAIEKRYLDFFKALRDAEPKFMKANLIVVQTAAVGGDWRAADRRLAYKFPEQFGKQVTMRGDPKHPIPLVPVSGSVMILPDNRRGGAPKSAMASGGSRSINEKPAAKPKKKPTPKPKE